MQLITAPESLNLLHFSVFLAGSIEQDVAEKWQDRVITVLSNLNITILNPRRKEWDASWVQSINNSQFHEQVSWELSALEKADIVIVYFDKNTKNGGIDITNKALIDEKGDVLLHIHPSVINIKEQTKTIKISDSTLELPLAQSEIRESDTVIKAASGDVVVIGGLMKSENIELVSKVPLLGNIPYLGEAFTNRANSTVKTELVILLKPVVVGADTWETELKRSQELLDRWYPEEE